MKLLSAVGYVYVVGLEYSKFTVGKRSRFYRYFLIFLLVHGYYVLYVILEYASL